MQRTINLHDTHFKLLSYILYIIISQEAFEASLTELLWAFYCFIGTTSLIITTDLFMEWCDHVYTDIWVNLSQSNIYIHYSDITISLGCSYVSIKNRICSPASRSSRINNKLNKGKARDYLKIILTLKYNCIKFSNKIHKDCTSIDSVQCISLHLEPLYDSFFKYHSLPPTPPPQVPW